MPEHHTHTLFQSDSLLIEDFHCDGAKHSGEEWALQHEIVFPRFGSFVRYDASGVVVADVNQVLFFHQHQPYEISHPIPGGDKSTVFAVAPEVLLDILYLFDPSVADHPARLFPASHAAVQTRQRLLQYVLIYRAIHDETAEPLAVEEQVFILVAEILGEVYRQSRQPLMPVRQATARDHAEIADHVKLILSERFRSQLKLDEIARAVHCSSYHLCRVFRRETGMAIHQYLQRLRLLNALEQLAEHPHQSLTETAFDLGFASSSHFSTAFRREFGITPLEFRRTATRQKLDQMSKILKV